MSNNDQRYLVIGNGVAGTTAAETIRKRDPLGKITIITDEPYPLYNRVALPRFLRGDIEQQRVMMRSLETHQRKDIELLLETRVVRVNSAENTVLLHDGRELPYDKLLIATGGTPRRLDASGAADAEGIHHFQSLDDAKRLIAHAEIGKSAVTIGGSYIAYELTEGLRSRGLTVTWLIRGPHFLHRVLDAEGGALVDQIARRHGVQVFYQDQAAEIRLNAGTVKGVVTTAGRYVDCDLVAAGLGLILNTDLLAGSGVEVNRGVVTDAYLRTNIPNIFAGGDVAEFYDTFLGGQNIMGTWNNAQGHGKVVGLNMTGVLQPYTDIPHYTTTMFDSTMTVIGMTTEANPDLESVTFCNPTSESYRRLFFDQEGHLVGAVLIGDLRPRRTIAEMIRSRKQIADRQLLLQELS